jgi:hypothetical protein
MLFVSPVPPSTTVEAFQALFKAYGQVKNFRPRGEVRSLAKSKLQSSRIQDPEEIKLS